MSEELDKTIKTLEYMIARNPYNESQRKAIQTCIKYIRENESRINSYLIDDWYI